MNPRHSPLAVFLCAIVLTATTSHRPIENPPQASAWCGEKQQSLGPTPSNDNSCMYDYDRPPASNCIKTAANGEQFISHRVLRQLHFDSDGLATVMSTRDNWMYVSKTGKIIVSGVPTFDNGADDFHDGLVRVLKNKKYGFSNRKGQVVIPPIYDGAMYFDGGKAEVCNGCKTKWDPSCEHSLFDGGDWFQIDTAGAIIARLPSRHYASVTE